MPIILNTSVSSTFQKLAGRTIVSKSFIIYIFLKYRKQDKKGKRVKSKQTNKKNQFKMIYKDSWL